MLWPYFREVISPASRIAGFFVQKRSKRLRVVKRVHANSELSIGSPQSGLGGGGELSWLWQVVCVMMPAIVTVIVASR